LKEVGSTYQRAATDHVVLELSMQQAAEQLVERNRQLQREMSERERVEGELRLAQKLEAVGQLAAGIAHEINTPVQYVGDTFHFVRESFEALVQYIGAVNDAVAELGSDALRERIAKAAEDADLAYLDENLPDAFSRAFDGLERVTKIVRAMKEFAHPDQKEMTLSDLNRAIQNTVAVAHHELKYSATVDLDLGDVPPVRCHIGEVNQVILNLLVNAAHAIQDQKREEPGHIWVKTYLEGEHVVVAIKDDGGGIPEEHRARIFDPFYTTKEVGRGSGQGLALARSTICEKHHGLLDYTTEVGVGTTFFIRLCAQGEPTEATR
jgi:signal transduction histidine kinase